MSFCYFFQLIGCSILVMHDKLDKCGAWIIDYSKTNLIEDGCEITHRLPWELGNHEDGFLFGLDNLIQVGYFTAFLFLFAHL